MMVLNLTQCKKQTDDNNNNPDESKVKVTCVVPMNNGGKSEFDNIMTDGSIKWSAGTERIYLAIPDETSPQIVELTAFTTLESNILAFEGEVESELIQAGEYDVYYLGNSKNIDLPYYSETKDGDVITKISGSIANQSGSLDDLGYCHIAKTTVTAETSGEEVVLSLNGTLKNQIAIAHLDLNGITNLKGSAIIGTEYALQYNEGTSKFEFAVTESVAANINVTSGTATSYVVLLPNATANVDLKSNTSKKVTFVDGIEANKIYYKHISDVEYKPLVWEDDCIINVHEYVDLGLPSGLKWATCNVGATSPEDYGNYYAWGETSTKSTYTNSNSLTYGLSISQLESQGYIDGSGNLTSSHDAATANWGGSWRMPTKEEQQELVDECTWERTTQNGVNGCKVTGPNGNYIFLPAAGSRYGSSLIGEGDYGFYWSSTPSDYGIGNDAYDLYFSGGDEYVDWLNRLNGHTVRPITE